MQLVEIIQNALYEQNYVVVPNLGGFITRPVSSTFSKGNKLIFPPKKQLFFNEKLIQDDGLLVNELVKTQKLTYAKAQKLINEEVNSWKQLLTQGKKLHLKEIGVLSLNENRQLQFEQNPHTNFLIDSYGFDYEHVSKFEAKLRKDEQDASKQPIEKQIETIIIEQIPVSYKNFQKLSAAAIIVLTISATYLYLLSFNPIFIEKAGLNFFNFPLIDTVRYQAKEALNETDLDSIHEELTDGLVNSDAVELNEETNSIEDNQTSIPSEPKTEEERAPAEKIVIEETISPSKPIKEKPSKKTQIVDEIAKGKSNEVVESNLNSKQLYYVVVSSLNSSEKIDLEIKRFKQKGYSPLILPAGDGNFRISIGSFASKDSAETFKQNILNDNKIDGWILKK